MKLQCGACQLRLDKCHFLEKRNVLRSICDICILRGLLPDNYENIAAQTYARAEGDSYVGGTQNTEHIKIQQARAIEAFMQDFDGNVIAQQQVTRNDLYKKIIAIEDGQMTWQVSGNLKENLAALGFQVEFDLNEVDFISREMIRREFHHRCQYCGRRGDSVDHKNPVSISHDNSLDNLTLACSECNIIKGNMPYELFIALNNQISDVNEALVHYENLMDKLKKQFRDNHNELVAMTHLKGDVRAPELVRLRVKSKALQDLVDTVQSDYDGLRKARKNFFESRWKMVQQINNNG